jgi:hypothetical protein
MNRESDLEWTLNQVRFSASYGEAPGMLEIQMGTVTPYLDTFLVKTDDGGWAPSTRVVQWRLHPGRNRLEMRVRNKAGVLGRVSHVELDYEG